MFRVGIVCLMMWGLVGCGGKKLEPVVAIEAETEQQESVEAVVEPVTPAPAPAVAKVFCGGIAGILCPHRQHCTDDPDDACDPSGGSDCGGMCVVDAADANQVPACLDTATHRYIADAETCKVVRFACPEGEFGFGDDCGCGCTTQVPQK